VGEELEGLERCNGSVVSVGQDAAVVRDERVPRVRSSALIIECRLGQAADDLMVLGITDLPNTFGVLWNRRQSQINDKPLPLKMQLFSRASCMASYIACNAVSAENVLTHADMHLKSKHVPT